MTSFPPWSKALGFRWPDRVSFSSRGIPPPAGQYIEQGSSLFVRSFSAVGVREVILRVRILTAAGEVKLLSFTHRTQSVFSVKEETFGLREGFLLGVAAGPVDTGLSNAAIYVSVALAFAQGAAFTVMQPLFADYIDTAHFVGWPGGRSILPREGPGNLVTLGETIGGAGAAVDEGLPTGVVWRLISVRARLVTDANVANRFVGVFQMVGGDVIRAAVSPTAQTASTTIDHQISVGATDRAAVGGQQTTNLGMDFWIETGTLRVNAVNMQAGDVLRVYVTREEFIEPFV